jgi:hypothetical protein
MASARHTRRGWKRPGRSCADCKLSATTCHTDRCALDGNSNGGFEICIDGLSIWLMRIAREIGHGAAL